MAASPTDSAWYLVLINTGTLQEQIKLQLAACPGGKSTLIRLDLRASAKSLHAKFLWSQARSTSWPELDRVVKIEKPGRPTDELPITYGKPIT
jgi:hypothetical protein